MIENKEELVGCKEIKDNFYTNENIYNKIFIYSFQMRESFMTAEHTIEIKNEYIPIGFQFKKNFHPAFDSKQKTIAVLFDNRFFISNSNYVFHMNLLFSSKNAIKSILK